MYHEKRRKELLKQIGNDIAVIPTAPMRQRNSDVYYPFRPDSDFYYLTHFPEPSAVAVFAPGSKYGDFILFCQERDPEREIWDGHRYGPQGAVDEFSADSAFPICDLDEKIAELLIDREVIHCCIGRYPDFDERVVKWLNKARMKTRSGKASPQTVIDISRTVHQMRLYKNEDECSIVSKVAKITAAAHMHVMKHCLPGMMEYEIQAMIEHEFQVANCQTAYPSIVAAGENACILHYINNSSELKKDQLLLIDAGAEYDCYASDITRTFPVSGKFSARQKDVYEIVLEAQTKAIEAAMPGNRYEDVDSAAVTPITQGLIDLGILKCSLSEALETNAYRQYYMHKIGHWLGLDVHDVGPYQVNGESTTLEPGFYMTVEPGIYLSPSDELDEGWHGIGIRIEDDVLIEQEGHRITTSDVVKTISDIEQWMAG